MDNLNDLPKKLLPWYKKNARKLPWRENKDPYCVWISEIMLQQTRVEAVIEYYNRFLKAIPDMKTLALVDDEKLLKLWEGLGYYTRAKNLKRAAREILEKHNGVFPHEYALILELPGIGPYTAGAISSICFDLPIPAVDGNVLRVLSRITNSSAPIDEQKTKTDIFNMLKKIYPKKDPGDFTQALMELGAVICTPQSPKCQQCPLRTRCRANAAHTVSNIPVKSVKKAKKLIYKTIFLFECHKKFALIKRKQDGLLGGMWQFPEIDGKLSLQQAVNAAQEMGVHPVQLYRKTEKSHIFTHLKWDMRCYHILCADQTPNFVWETLEKIRDTYALPTAFKQFIEES